MDEQIARRVSAFGRDFVYFGEIPEWRVLRIFSKINFDGPGGCWEWTGTLKTKGYGGIRIFEGGGREVLAHRHIWHLLRGSLPTHIHLHHKCENKRCVNPDHLQPLTPREHFAITPQNIASAGTWVGGKCRSEHPLTEENLYVSPSGHRRCRTCFNEWQTRRNQLAAERREIKMPVSECANGHEFTPENTYTYQGLRYCRACHNDVTGRRYHEKKAERGISSSKRSLFADRKVCKRGHDLTLPDAIYNFQLHGKPKSMCRECHRVNGAAYWKKRRLAHVNDPKPPRRKPGPKPKETQWK